MRTKARSDAARLDWLETWAIEAKHESYALDWVSWSLRAVDVRQQVRRRSLRDAIDAAMTAMEDFDARRPFHDHYPSPVADPCVRSGPDDPRDCLRRSGVSGLGRRDDDIAGCPAGI